MKNKIVIGLLFGLACALSIVSCDKDVAIPPYQGFADDFIKLRVGTTWVYQIDSQSTDIIGPDKRSVHFQKEIVRDVERSHRNATYTIDVYSSVDTTEGYTFTDKYTLELYEDRMVHMGSDYNIIMLTEPMNVGHKWYNLNNTKLNAQSVVNDKLDTYSLMGITYNDVVDVIHYEYFHHDISQLHRSYYGQDVSLIYEMRFNRLRNKKTTIIKSLLTYAY